MANTDKRNGFQLYSSAGVQTRRVTRTVTAAGNASNDIAAGDAYIIQADGTITRATSATAQANGIVEAIVLKGINEGPISYDYLPKATAGEIIGIEDANAEFEVTASVALALADYDAGAIVALADTTPDTVLRQSRQAIGAINGSGGFHLVKPVDRVNNDQFSQYARVRVRLLPANVQ